MATHTRNPGPAEQDGSATRKSEIPARPDVNSDRAAPGRPAPPADGPLPIEEIEAEEDDAKGG